MLRLDFNTEDTWRLEAALPTVRLLQKHARAIVIVSHRGRPALAKSHGFDAKLSLRNDAATLSELLKKDVVFLPDFRFTEIRKAIQAAPRGSIFLLENIRFLAGEGENSAALAKDLASLGDYFVNDAFAVSHRKAGSLVGVSRLLPSYAGLELEKEITFLGESLKEPRRPFIIVIGGGKAHDKLEVLKNFKDRADAFLLGGASANTIMKLRGRDVQKSVLDDDPADRVFLARLAKSNRVIVPADWRGEKNMILDIGPKTEREYARIIAHAKTILWAGPVGMIEKKKFAKGNLAIARAISKNQNALTITGGGETVMFLKQYKLDTKFSFVSTGGGAMLEFLAGKKLPGIEALQ